MDRPGGGAQESIRYDAQYRDTVATYEHVFDEPPPPDIWPDAEQRFGVDLACRRVNIDRNWVIPKPHWLQRRARTRRVAAAIALPVPLVLAELTNPLDLRGGDFLWLFGVLAAAAVGSGYALRRLFHPAGDDGPVDLSPLEVALLANDGRYRFAAAAMVVLATVDSTTGSATLKEPPPDAADPLLRRLHERLTAAGNGDAIHMLRTAQETAAEEEEPRLREM